MKKTNKKQVKRINKENYDQKEKSLKKEDKRDIGKDKVLIIGIVALLIIFGSLLAAIKLFGKKEQEVLPEIKVYNGFVFEKYENFWLTKVKTMDSYGNTKEFDIMFHYTPYEVEYIPTEKNIRNETSTPYIFMNAKRIYVTTEPDYPSAVILGGVEIAKIISQIYGKEVKGALTKEVENSNAPVITCGNLTDDQRVIYLQLSNETGIFNEYGCIVVKGTNTDELLKASERLAFEILKIL